MAGIAEPTRTDGPMRHVVLDTALLASAFVRPGSTGDRVWRATLADELHTLVATSSLVELSVLLAQRFGWRAEHVERALRQIARNATVATQPELDALLAAPVGQPSVGTVMAVLDEARGHADRVSRIAALEAMRDERSGDIDRWCETSVELAVAALEAGRREEARRVARSVIAIFDEVPDRDLSNERRAALATSALVATTGQEYLSHEESDEAIELLLRTMARFGEDALAARLACRAAEIVGMRPHAGAFLRPWSDSGAASTVSGLEPEALYSVDRLLGRAEALVALVAPDDPELTALLDVAWARAHPQHEHAAERRLRLGRSLRELRGFDRAWAGTRLALDGLAIGERTTLQQALLDASPTTVERSPLVSWKIEIVRAMLLLATGSPGAREAVEFAAAFGERANEPMAAIVAAVQRAVVRAEVDPLPLDDEQLRLAGHDAHPLIRIGRLELVTRTHALYRTITGAAPPADEASIVEVRELLDVLRTDGMNPGNQQLSAVLLARVLFNLRDVAVDPQLIADCAEMVEPLDDLVPTDALGLVCAGSAARHLANLRSLQSRHEEAEEIADRARIRDTRLGFERFLIAGRIDAMIRARRAGAASAINGGPRLLADAVQAERRGLVVLGREARIAANGHLHGVLDERGLAILEGLARGWTFARLARERGYSAGTLRKLALPVYRALGVAGRQPAVELARDAGLIPRPSAGPAALLRNQDSSARVGGVPDSIDRVP